MKINILGWRRKRVMYGQTQTKRDLQEEQKREGNRTMHNSN